MEIKHRTAIIIETDQEIDGTYIQMLRLWVKNAQPTGVIKGIQRNVKNNQNDK